MLVARLEDITLSDLSVSQMEGAVSSPSMPSMVYHTSTQNNFSIEPEDGFGGSMEDISTPPPLFRNRSKDSLSQQNTETGVLRFLDGSKQRPSSTSARGNIAMEELPEDPLTVSSTQAKQAKKMKRKGPIIDQLTTLPEDELEGEELTVDTYTRDACQIVHRILSIHFIIC